MIEPGDSGLERASGEVRPASRVRLAMSLAIPSLGGLGALVLLGAPTSFLVVNTGALALALVWTLFGRIPKARAARLAIAIALLAGLALPPLVGPHINGVSRWLTLSPVTLHSGPLVLPLLLVLIAREEHFGATLLAAAMAILAYQPDAASLGALGLASVVLALTRQSYTIGAIGLVCLALSAITFGAGALEPQPFVENVLPDVAEQSFLAAGALGLTIVAGLWCLARASTPTTGLAPELAALLAGFTLAAMLGPFPYPLIGYGAAPILGFGLALGAVWRKEQGSALAATDTHSIKREH